MSLIILAAGKPFGREYPSASERVLDEIPAANWTIASVGLEPSETQIVVGFRREEVQRLIPNVTIRSNPEWETSGSVASLFCADTGGLDNVLVTYSDIVFRRSLVEDIAGLEADVVVAFDSSFISGEQNSSRPMEKVTVSDGHVTASGTAVTSTEEPGFFPGLVKFSSNSLRVIENLTPAARRQLSPFHLSELVEYLRKGGASVCAVESKSRWARIEEPEELVRFILGSKADTLMRLGPLLKQSQVPSSFAFTRDEWSNNRQEILSEINFHWPAADLVVRSSAKSEDSFDESLAGAFLSVIGVSGRLSIEKAIESVFQSYSDSDSENQVLIQQQIKNLVANGVAVTRSVGTDAPWIAINFEISNRSDDITSGRSTNSQTLNIFRPSSEPWINRAKRNSLMEELPGWVPAVLDALHELEEIVHYSRLDVEFGVDRDGIIHVFQVRPLATNKDTAPPSDELFEEALKHPILQPDPPESIASRMQASTVILSNMTDWNPAEILGAAPRQLAVSIYEELITDQIWAESRAVFGYRDLRNTALLVNVAGRPYVDVSASIESFLPHGLDEEHSKGFVEFFLGWLKEKPELHDKVEFDVVPTCYSPKFPEWRDRLERFGGFGEAQLAPYEEKLRQITRNAIESIDDDFSLLENLDEEFQRILMDDSLLRTEMVKRVLSVCKKYGTLPFSNLARRGFIAVTLLKDAARCGILSDAAVNDFLGSIRSVSHEIGTDALHVSNGEMEWVTFIEKYGHLRPGTYDITSPRYDSQPEIFLRPLVDRTPPKRSASAKTSPWEQERNQLSDWVNEHLGQASAELIGEFLHQAIEGRESAKFSFTRLLSWVLEELKKIGTGWGLTIEDMSHLRIEQVLEAAEHSENQQGHMPNLQKLMTKNRREQKLATLMQLPGVITSIDDLFMFMTGLDSPNFVGTVPLVEKSVYLKAGETVAPGSINARIVLIEAADPGFDWIFGHDIRGLVTKFGGGNSHMAIRAAEFGLSAAIGVGEALFTQLLDSKVIELNPTNQLLRGL